jgi:hypothetical protein
MDGRAYRVDGSARSGEKMRRTADQLPVPLEVPATRYSAYVVVGAPAMKQELHRLERPARHSDTYESQSRHSAYSPGCALPHAAVSFGRATRVARPLAA